MSRVFITCIMVYRIPCAYPSAWRDAPPCGVGGAVPGRTRTWQGAWPARANVWAAVTLLGALAPSARPTRTCVTLHHVFYVLFKHATLLLLNGIFKLGDIFDSCFGFCLPFWGFLSCFLFRFLGFLVGFPVGFLVQVSYISYYVSCFVILYISCLEVPYYISYHVL